MIETKRRTTLQKIWREMRRDPMVMGAVAFLVGIYTITLFLAGFLAPYSEYFTDREMAYSPPTPIFIVDGGKPSWPFVVAYERRFDSETYGFAFYPDYSRKYPIQLFAKGEPYKLLGLIPTDRHLIGVAEPARIFLLGTDISGRDIFSRLLYGGQISLTIGFLGLFVAFPVALIYGGVSGYFGGRVDNAMMRVAEIIMSFPSFYLLLSLTVLLPSDLTSTQRFALIVMILAFVGWAGLARVIRGMILSLKENEYIEASRALGSSSFRIITKHLLPQTSSYVIIAITLGVPGYLLAESTLSFLGLGIQPPDASWGNMLREAQDLSNIMLRPWLLIAPGALLFFTILSFNVIGDKIRDILDPKSHGKAA